MAYPKQGMTYEQCKAKLKKLGSNPNLRSSILNQCRLAEGEKAQKELEKEFSYKVNRSRAFSGAGNKQVGIGDGVRMGTGKWRCMQGKWEKIS